MKIKTIPLDIPKKDKEYIKLVEDANKKAELYNPIPREMFGTLGNKRYGFIDTFIYGGRKP
jgi:hypothetical protein